MAQIRKTQIDPKAFVMDGAQLDPGVVVGPFSVIGSDVRIGADTVIGPHVVIEGKTTIGAENRIFQFASVGAIPQDLKYGGENSELIIGDRNRIREFVTVNKGTGGGGMVTTIGNDNLLMAYTHIAHDCCIGNGVILANAATLGGHVTLEDGSIIAGLSGIHQFCRVGRMAFVGAGSIVVLDVPPFTTVQGDRAKLSGLNVEGLKRKGFSGDQINSLKKAYRTLFRSGMVLEEAVLSVRSELSGDSNVELLIEFVSASRRGVTR